MTPRDTLEECVRLGSAMGLSRADTVRSLQQKASHNDPVAVMALSALTDRERAEIAAGPSESAVTLTDDEIAYCRSRCIRPDYYLSNKRLIAKARR